MKRYKSYIDKSDIFTKIKNREIHHPTNSVFDPELLAKVVLENPDLSIRDSCLFQLALVVFSELKVAREKLSVIQKSLALADAVDFSLALVNFQCVNVIKDCEKQLRLLPKDKPIDLAKFNDAHVRNIGGQVVNIDEAAEGLADNLPQLVFHLASNCQAKDMCGRDQVLAQSRYIQAYASIEKALSEIWNMGLWEGYSLGADGNQFILKPCDVDFTAQWDIWRKRDQLVLMSNRNLDYGDAVADDAEVPSPPILAKTVIRIDQKSGKKAEYRLGRPVSSREHVDFVSYLESSYLSVFLDEPLNLQGGKLTFMDLVKAFLIVRDFTKLKSKAIGGEFSSWVDVRRNLICLDVQRHKNIFCICLNISRSESETLINILSSDIVKGDDLFAKNIWGAPLIKIGSDSLLRIALPSVINPNPVYVFENWLRVTNAIDKKGKSKGRTFEAFVKEMAKDLGSKNRHFSDFSVFDTSQKDGEEIDLVIAVGNLIIVCEVKCFVGPYSSQEKYNRNRKLVEATEQVERKRIWLKKNISKYTDFENDQNLKFYSLVVLNDAFGCGQMAGHTTIVDLNWFKTVLSSNAVVTQGRYERQLGKSFSTVEIYGSCEDFEQRVGEIMAEPPMLKMIKKEIRSLDRKFPLSYGGNLIIRQPVVS
ncbi:nuclease-related domain superfamily [Roseibium sp. TrichSKD4]|uniref:nuclease-related domain-containing protein n=1 Tax=Roseibium sp. TrichSKD4 TaxID=744980 RepID=UPI0001E56C39|nr:nuclease-related domain-containing protein [Roseibium sp. TrichSKD4]EFO32686.1 nuclease-related domain superfamily [Roseibium sp. TrichSKD4]